MSTSTSQMDKKGHVCPPSNATHPSDRWESLFVYSFICKFTNLRQKTEGLDTPMDFEDALLSREPNPILCQILARFVLNLRPQTRNLSIDQISTTVTTVLADYLKSSERLIYWDDNLKVNIDPFSTLEGGFFTADWDFKLKFLRQLVELQLCHTPEIKGAVDRAWGVSQGKHKKKDAATAPPDPSDSRSQDKLQLVPIGQDLSRKRYWVADDSPRVYYSTNPWKISATFHTVASTRDDYLAVIEDLKASAPPPPTKKNAKRSKPEIAHLALITALEERIEAIDAELTRVQRVKRKIEQRNALIAQAAELRETRTRRQTRRPDYVYNSIDFEDEDDADEYRYQEDEANDDEFEDDDSLRDNVSNGRRIRRASTPDGVRRSSRTAVLNANGKRDAPADPWTQWRGERRSTRLGAPLDTQLDTEPPLKRARTEESTVSTTSVDAPVASTSNGLKLKTTSAAALKPTEVALEQIAGKRRSKFWVYAVEPIPGAAPAPSGDSSPKSMSNGASSGINGHDMKMERDDSLSAYGNGNGGRMDVDENSDGSLSPLDS